MFRVCSSSSLAAEDAPLAIMAEEDGAEHGTETLNPTSEALGEPKTAQISNVGPTTPANADEPQPEAASVTTPSIDTTPDTTSSVACSQPVSAPTPAKRRPKPPTKGILKPPPPPAKPTLGNRLRDIVVGSVNASGVKTLWDPTYSGYDSDGAGPSRSPPSVTAAVGETLTALSGRLSSLGRLVASTPTTPTGSPRPRGMTLAEAPMLENRKQKQPLRRATFVLPALSITYPISTQGEPWSEKILLERAKASFSTLVCEPCLISRSSLPIDCC